LPGVRGGQRGHVSDYYRETSDPVPATVGCSTLARRMRKKKEFKSALWV